MKCRHTKTDGNQCRANALGGSNFCFWHHPDRKKEVIEAGRTGGLKGKLVVLPLGTPDIVVATMADVVILMEATINQVRRGEMDPRVANTVGYLAGIFMKAYEGSGLEVQLQELYQRIEAVKGVGQDASTGNRAVHGRYRESR